MKTYCVKKDGTVAGKLILAKGTIVKAETPEGLLCWCDITHVTIMIPITKFIDYTAHLGKDYFLGNFEITDPKGAVYS